MKLRTQDDLTTCRGDCELTIRGVLVRASEIDYYRKTSEAEARGNVRIYDHGTDPTAAVSHQP
jgi:lipopolysaccharide assembly outer membrane protein LptD (OstA)